MSDFSDRASAANLFPQDGNRENQSPESSAELWADESNWVDAGEEPASRSSQSPGRKSPQPPGKATPALVMVETAFLASTASLIWLINFYFPPGPLLRLVFPVPIALIYLRRGLRAAWMTALIAGLLLSVLMGPMRSVLFVMPYGVLGVQLGACWRRGMSWYFSIAVGTIIGTFGFFFRFWLLSILIGEDLWAFGIAQVTEFTEWIFVQLGLLTQPSFLLIQAIALVMVIVSSIIYLFVVHLVAMLILDRLGSPIPPPPRWVQVILSNS